MNIGVDITDVLHNVAAALAEHFRLENTPSESLYVKIILSFHSSIKHIWNTKKKN